MASLDLKSNTDRVLVGLLVLAAVLAAAVFLWPQGKGEDGGGATPSAASGLPNCKGEDRLMIPDQKLRARLVSIQTKRTDRGVELDPPSDPNEVGWWDESAAPGHAEGQTMITGHTVHNGSGALNRIGELRKGKVVKVCKAGKLATYRTTRIVELSKAQVAAQAHDLFGQHRKDGRLVLVTCTDWVGPGNYRSNLIVFGRPTRLA